jgi:tRNA pseudouridine55 synthase
MTQANQPVNVTESQFEEVLKTFIGEIEQTPPPYSAVKVQGRKAYEMARQGEDVELTPRKITVHHLEVLEWAPPEVVIDVHCSSGTYVRSLANDLGEKLGCGAYLVGLRRTKSGRFSLRDAVPLRKLQESFHAGNWYQYLIPAAEALGDWPAVELSPDEVEGVRHGHRVKAETDSPMGSRVRGVSTQGELVALMELVTGEDGNPAWQPKKVFFTSE